MIVNGGVRTFIEVFTIELIKELIVDVRNTTSSCFCKLDLTILLWKIIWCTLDFVYYLYMYFFEQSYVPFLESRIQFPP